MNTKDPENETIEDLMDEIAGIREVVAPFYWKLDPADLQSILTQALTTAHAEGVAEERERIIEYTEGYLELRPNSNTLICERIGAEGTIREILQAIKKD